MNQAKEIFILSREEINRKIKRMSRDDIFNLLASTKPFEQKIIFRKANIRNSAKLVRFSDNGTAVKLILGVIDPETVTRISRKLLSCRKNQIIKSAKVEDRRMLMLLLYGLRVHHLTK